MEDAQNVGQRLKGCGNDHNPYSMITASSIGII
jgi:hypothetical protein